ncbi:MAG: 2-oxoglutarate dehydrogenase complex dihydrolipoyllysine-residue succinyltransferase [Phycisphaerales bacterium]|nr:2-oxoglutarate dehydrogenase complex dihydrolipoyllysine-residue succinyltransferase [Phycisphaerales bacterium]
MPPTPVDIVIPTIGDSINTGVIAAWRKKDGEAVQRDETVLDLETDKVTMEIPAPAAGVVKRIAKEGDTVSVGAVVGTVDTAGVATAAAASPAPEAAAAAPAAVAPGKAEPAPAKAASKAATPTPAESDAHATPLAKKTAEEHGVDLSKVKGTFAGGRIREKDVLEALSTPVSTPAPSAKAPSAAADTARGITRERMTPLRQRIASRLVQAQHTAAMLTTFNECDMGAVMDLRKQHKEEFEKRHGIGLGFMGFFVKAAVQALKAFPLVNASVVDDEGSPAIEKHDYCDIAVAVSTPKGLVVPVLRNCEKLSLARIELGIKDLATRAKDGKLALDDMQGGTFTITNGGVFGSLMSTPILNPPQSGILGMHAIKNRAIEFPAGSGQVAIRPMMYLALSYDHRIIDGAAAVQFLVKIKNCIEDPARLLLDL